MWRSVREGGARLSQVVWWWRQVAEASCGAAREGIVTVAGQNRAGEICKMDGKRSVFELI